MVDESGFDVEIRRDVKHRWGAGAERAQWAMQRGGGILSKGASQARAPRGDHCEVDRGVTGDRFLDSYKSVTSEAIELGFGLLVIRNIPCYKCEECDEIFYTGDVVQKIETIVNEAKQLMQEMRIINFEGGGVSQGTCPRDLGAALCNSGDRTAAQQ